MGKSPFQRPTEDSPSQQLRKYPWQPELPPLPTARPSRGVGHVEGLRGVVWHHHLRARAPVPHGPAVRRGRSSRGPTPRAQRAPRDPATVRSPGPPQGAPRQSPTRGAGRQRPPSPSPALNGVQPGPRGDTEKGVTWTACWSRALRTASYRPPGLAPRNQEQKRHPRVEDDGRAAWRPLPLSPGVCHRQWEVIASLGLKGGPPPKKAPDLSPLLALLGQVNLTGAYMTDRFQGATPAQDIDFAA